MDRNALKKLLLSTLVILTSIALAGASVALAIFLLSARPAPGAGLASRIDVSRTELFVRSAQSATLARIARNIIPSPVFKDGGKAGLYELALLRTETGGVQWIISMTESGSTQTTIVSETNPSLFLPIRKGEKSLAEENLFRQTVADSTKNVLWVDLRSPLPLAQSKAGDILASALAHYETALLVWDDPLQGDLILVRSATSQGKSLKTTPLPVLPEDALLVLRSDRPLELMDSFVALVHSHSPELVDGVGGIIKAIGDRFAHSTDIRLFAEDLLRQPVTVAVLPGNEGGKNILLAGEASNARTIETWAAALASAMTPGIVRTERFFKENTRKDIIAATENVRAELEPIGDFAVSRLGASGGNVVIFIAHRGRQFVASTDAGLLRTVLEMNQKPPSGSVTKEEWGTADLPWLLSFIESVAGNAGKEVRTLSDALLGSDLWRVRWQLTRRPDTDRFHWSVQRSSVPPASGHGTTGKR